MRFLASFALHRIFLGEMGGGDSLYAAIDKGIRNAKVVVICMNSKYPQSENCTKEVFLAQGVDKPIIPILMESTKFPPDGRQKSALAKCNCIPFYPTKNEVRFRNVYLE